MNIVFEKMTEKDILSVANIEKECFSDNWSKNVLSSSMKLDCYDYYVLKEDGVVVGYFALMTVDGESEILRIAVTNSARGKGKGSYLMENLLIKAKDKKSNKLFLEVRESNDVAKKLYQKFGFVHCGQRKNYYEGVENADLYTLTLGEN